MVNWGSDVFVGENRKLLSDVDYKLFVSRVEGGFIFPPEDGERDFFTDAEAKVFVRVILVLVVREGNFLVCPEVRVSLPTV